MEGKGGKGSGEGSRKGKEAGGHEEPRGEEEGGTWKFLYFPRKQGMGNFID